MTVPVTIRPGRDDEADGFTALIGACWGEYPSIVFDVDAELPEIHALATYYAAKGGRLWAAEADGTVAGMIATVPHGDGGWEICRLYVLAPWRGVGLAHRLLDQAEAHAMAAGAIRLLLWSDTRFDRAHQFYEKRGYVRAGPIRVLNDLSNSLEFGYAKPVNGVEVLDAAAAASAERAFADLLVTCVNDGAGLSFQAPLAPEVARSYWRARARAVTTGGRAFLAGWADGAMAGCVMLDFDTPADQHHCAEVKKLLVHPAARRHGLARALLHRAEQEAARAGRTLLTLDARAGSAADTLYRREGWTEAGRIPDATQAADGTFSDTLIFYKRIAPTSAPRT
jgi:GNAT superfamily N-acetyltransferase